MGFAEYDRFDALGLAELVKRGEVTPQSLIDELASRVERHDGRLNGVVVRLFDEARAAAKGPLVEGPFRGVPLLTKELDTAVAGSPQSFGSRFMEGVRSAHDARIIRQHRAAGFIIAGKTNAPELGLVPFTEPRLWGPARNPWDPTRTPGGSSGGAAVAVAAGYVPVAHGGDGGGSIRIPASCCGLFGLKPTRGRTPIGPDRSESWNGFVVEHALTRTVRDSAALLDATAIHDPDSVHTAPPPARPFTSEVGAPPGRLRIRFTTKPHLPGNVAPECRAAVDDAARLLADLGHDVDEVDLGIDADAFGADFFMIVCVEAASAIAQLGIARGRRPRRRDFETATWLTAMLGRRHGAVAAALARARLQALARQVARAFEDFDVLLTPTLGQPPIPLGALLPKGAEAFVQEMVATLGLGFVLSLPPVVRATVNRVFTFMPFTPLANVTGQPSMNVPLHFSAEGLPIGTMFTGRFGDEATLFRLAGQLEAARPWKDRRPRLS